MDEAYIQPLVGTIFGIMAAYLFLKARRLKAKHDPGEQIGIRVTVRLAIIFAIVAIGLICWHYLGP